MKQANRINTILKKNKVLIIASVILFIFLITVRIINNLAIVEGNTNKCNFADKGSMRSVENRIAGLVGTKVLIKNNIESIQTTIKKIEANIKKHSSDSNEKGKSAANKIGKSW